MSQLHTTRPDLLDNGVFRRTPADKATPAARTPQLLGEANLQEDLPQTTSYFVDTRGQATIHEADSVAKVDTTAGRDAYFVKFATGGVSRGTLCNPRGMYFEGRHLQTDERRSGRARYEFRQVNKEVFDDYMNYLVGHDATFLRRAERAVLDA